MSERMTAEDAMEIIADEAMVLGPPFDTNPMARAGKALQDEIDRLQTLVRMVCAEGAAPSGLDIAHGHVPSVFDQVRTCKRVLATAEAAMKDPERVDTLNKNWCCVAGPEVKP